jgi:hypothetical protein
MIDIAYLAFNRLEFTVQSFPTMVENTDWGHVSSLSIYDAGSTDGTLDFLRECREEYWPFKPNVSLTRCKRDDFQVMRTVTRTIDGHTVIIVDNDMLLPPGWESADQATVLSRIPTEPWKCLAKVYVYRRWQSESKPYAEEQSALWSWWNPKVYA